MTPQEAAVVAIDMLNWLDDQHMDLNAPEKIVVLKSAAVILEYVEGLQGDSAFNPSAFQKPKT